MARCGRDRTTDFVVARPARERLPVRESRSRRALDPHERRRDRQFHRRFRAQRVEAHPMSSVSARSSTNLPTAAQRLAAALKRHGVEIMFSQSLPSALILACEDLGIRQVSYRTENAGGAMADGYARRAHRIGVVTAQN